MGARLRFTPTERLYLMAGAYNGDPQVEDEDNHGTDFSLRGPVFAIAEIGYRLNQEKDATGLPGTYKAGIFYHNGLYPRVLNRIAGSPVPLPSLEVRVSRGNGGFYVMFEQTVYRERTGSSPRSLTPFLSVLISPDQDKSPIPYFVNAGIVSQGPIPGRPNDTALFGVSWGRFSDAFQRAGRLSGGAIPVPRDEMALEWGYAIQLTPWLKVQPDIQYIIRPGGTGRVPNALILGFEFGVVF
jgi:porin